LQAIHEAGVIHRDLKPANITRDADGLVRLMDFGIAKAFGDDSAGGVTGTGQIVGSPEYMSPEQWRGLELDFRSDLYALGVAVFEMFTGHPPFRGESAAAVMVKHLQSPPPLDGPEASRIPSALLPVLQRALAKEPADRYASCREMVAALRAARDALRSQLTDDVGSPASGPDDDAPTSLVDRARVPAVVSASRRAEKRGPSAHSRYAKHLVPVLARALSHERASVRAGAARAMARIGTDASAAAGALVTAASDTDTDVRSAASAALALVAPEGECVSGASIREAPSPEPAPASAAAPEPAAVPPSEGTGWTVPPPVRPPPPPPSPAPARPARDAAPLRPPGKPSFPKARVVAILSIVAAATGLALLALRSCRAPEDRSIPQSPPATLAPTPAPTPEVVEPAVSPPPPASAAPQPTAAPTLAVEPARPQSPRPRPTPATVAAREAAAPPAPTPLPSASVAPEPTPAPVVTPSPEEPAVAAPTPAPPAPSRDVVLPPACVRCPPPPYPEIAQRLGLTGRVRLRLDMDDKGIVTGVLVIEGPRELAERAVKTVRKWSYRPATRNGAPIPYQVEVYFDFQ
jgi:serine/threonine-protein kinase